MIVMHRSTPATTWAMAIQIPAKMNHNTLPMAEPAPASGLVQHGAPERPQRIVGQPERGDSERNRNDEEEQHEHQEPERCVPDRQPQARKYEPEDIADGLHLDSVTQIAYGTQRWGTGRRQLRQVVLLPRSDPYLGRFTRQTPASPMSAAGSAPLDLGVGQARAFAFRASNSAWVIVPESSKDLAEAI